MNDLDVAADKRQEETLMRGIVREEISQLLGDVESIRELVQELRDNRVEEQRIVKENQDSITIGTPASGQIKVYGDAGKPDELRKRLADMKQILKENK